MSTDAQPSTAERSAESVVGSEPTEAETRATLTLFAWRFHGACKGKGYRIKGEKLEACSCAGKRMRRFLEAQG